MLVSEDPISESGRARGCTHGRGYVDLAWWSWGHPQALRLRHYRVVSDRRAPLQPGTLGAAPHVHLNEDEYSFVLEGEVGGTDRRARVYGYLGNLRLEAPGAYLTPSGTRERSPQGP